MLTFILPAIVVIALSLPLIKVFKGEASVNRRDLAYISQVLLVLLL